MNTETAEVRSKIAVDVNEPTVLTLDVEGREVNITIDIDDPGEVDPTEDQDALLDEATDEDDEAPVPIVEPEPEDDEDADDGVTDEITRAERRKARRAERQEEEPRVESPRRGAGTNKHGYVDLPETFDRVHEVSKGGQMLSAIKKAKPGEAVIVAPGVMNFRDSNVKPDAKCAMKIHVPGNPDEQPIYILAREPGKTTIRGYGHQWHGNNYVVGGFNLATGQIRVHGCDIKFCHNQIKPGFAFYRPGRRIEMAYNEHVNARTFYGQTLGAVCAVQESGIYGPKHVHIHHCVYRDFPKKEGKEKEVFMLGYGYEPLAEHYDNDIECVIEDCTFDNVQGDDEAISIKSNKNTIRRNTFSRMGWAALVIRMGRRNLIYHNWSTGHGKTGMRVSGHDNVIAYNYFQGGTNALQMHTCQVCKKWEHKKWGYWTYVDASQNVIQNNVFSGFKRAIRSHASGGGPLVRKAQDNIITRNQFYGTKTQYVHEQRPTKLSGKIPYPEAEFNAANTLDNEFHDRKLQSTKAFESDLFKGDRTPVDCSHIKNLPEGITQIDAPDWW